MVQGPAIQTVGRGKTRQSRRRATRFLKARHFSGEAGREWKNVSGCGSRGRIGPNAGGKSAPEIAADWESGSSGRLRSARFLELLSKPAAKLACFSENFFTGRLRKSEHHFLIFERVQKGHVVLIVDDNDGEDGP